MKIISSKEVYKFVYTSEEEKEIHKKEMFDKGFQLDRNSWNYWDMKGRYFISNTFWKEYDLRLNDIETEYYTTKSMNEIN